MSTKTVSVICFSRYGKLLMHAMGPNVAGVIGTAVAAGTFMAVFGV